MTAETCLANHFYNLCCQIGQRKCIMLRMRHKMGFTKCYPRSLLSPVLHNVHPVFSVICNFK